MSSSINFALVIPLANEAGHFDPLITAVQKMLDDVKSGKVYLVVDNASKDNTHDLCKALSQADNRFVTVFEPANKNVVDAYLRGYEEAFKNGHDFIIEMDAGLSHEPALVPQFLNAYTKGNDCVFGSRFMKGGSMNDSGFKRKFLSRFGTVLSNVMLGSRLSDMTSGYQGFSREIVREILEYGLLSKAHFYQTEVRYLLRNKKYIEIPIHYKSPSPSVSNHAVVDSVKLLFFYFFRRISNNSKVIK